MTKISYAAAYHSLTHGDGSLFRSYCKANGLDSYGSPIEEMVREVREAEEIGGGSLHSPQQPEPACFVAPTCIECGEESESRLCTRCYVWDKTA